MQHSFWVEYDNVLIRQIREADTEQIRLWRNSANISKYLRPIGEITQEMQLEWYHQYLLDENNLTFAIEETGRLHRMVGTVSLYDFRGSESNCGKTVIGDPEAAGNNLGFRGEVLALHIGFQKLGIQYYITEVDQENIKSQKMTAMLGFKKVGYRPLNYRNGYEDQFKMTYKEFYEAHPYLKELEVMGG